MKIRILLLMLLLACGWTSPANCQDAPVGIIYGQDHSYILNAPPGWVLDNQVAVSQGLHAVFYPVGSSWQNSKAVMYTRVQNKDNKPLKQLIEEDLAHTAKGSSNFRATEEPPIMSKLKKQATVRYLSGDIHKSYEAIAYFEEPKIITLIILSSRTKEDFDKSLNAFEQLVKSYQFFKSTNPNEPAPEALDQIKQNKL